MNGEDTLFVYCKSGKLIAEADSDGNVTKEYVYLEGDIFAHFQYDVPAPAPPEAASSAESSPAAAPEPVADEQETVPPAVAETSTPSDTAFLPAIYLLLLMNDKSADGAYYYITDHLGAPQIITDDAGSVVWQAEYLPFGKVNISVANIENNLRFPGQYYDAETGLHYNWNRYYSPETGRYIAADPIGLDGGINLYAYVGGDPVNGFDPEGLYTEIIIWQPVGHGSSSFGHVSSNVNDKNYSWGPNGWDTRYPCASDYAKRQETFRSGVGGILNLTPEQECRLEECYARERKKYSALYNNCADPHQECLSDVLGTTLTDTLFPVDFGNALLGSPYYNGSTFYSGPEE